MNRYMNTILPDLANTTIENLSYILLLVNHLAFLKAAAVTPNLIAAIWMTTLIVHQIMVRNNNAISICFQVPQPLLKLTSIYEVWDPYQNRTW